jgi:hypothetical protein
MDEKYDLNVDQQWVIFKIIDDINQMFFLLIIIKYSLFYL